jgi:hypothetical protein
LEAGQFVEPRLRFLLPSLVCGRSSEQPEDTVRSGGGMDERHGGSCEGRHVAQTNGSGVVANGPASVAGAKAGPGRPAVHRSAIHPDAVPGRQEIWLFHDGLRLARDVGSVKAVGDE